ncbi:MAG: RDD family protein, partial [Burkholderiales bacterium]|nr:RDD family protein [Burkholderiales bacterium]
REAVARDLCGSGAIGPPPSGSAGLPPAASAGGNHDPVLPCAEGVGEVPRGGAGVGLSRAGLWRRFGAFVHELLFLVAYLFIVGLIFAAFSGATSKAGRPQILTGPIAVLQQIYLFASLGLYFVYFWTNGRRTLAFKTWGLRLVPAKARSIEPIATRSAIVRYFATWIGPMLGVLTYKATDGLYGLWLIALFANFLWALIDRDRQFLHDRIAGTRVVRSDA